MPAVRKTISHELKDAEKIIARSQVCFLAMSDQDIPYVVPMNFGYHEGYLYLHTGPGGKKLDILARNPEVSIAFSLDEKLHVRHETVACSYSMLYKSVVAAGKVEFVESPDEKKEILNHIMRQYTEKQDFRYNDPAVNNVVVFKVKIREICTHIREFG